MARKPTPTEPDGIVRTPEWPNGIQLNPHILSGCGGKCAPEPDFHPQLDPATPEIPQE